MRSPSSQTRAKPRESTISRSSPTVTDRSSAKRGAVVTEWISR